MQIKRELWPRETALVTDTIVRAHGDDDANRMLHSGCTIACVRASVGCRMFEAQGGEAGKGHSRAARARMRSPTAHK